VYVYVFVKFVSQRHERNITGRNQLVKKFADEYQFAGNVAFEKCSLQLLELLLYCTLSYNFLCTVYCDGFHKCVCIQHMVCVEVI